MQCIIKGKSDTQSLCAFPIILLFLKYPHGKAGRRIDRETVIMVKRRGLDDHGVFRRVQHSAITYINKISQKLRKSNTFSRKN